MLITLDRVLNATEIARARDLLRDAAWSGGEITAGV
jgi:predicted 2-oxoglutarate/Fe(II)-dependent dioxygenase YbiX